MRSTYLALSLLTAVFSTAAYAEDAAPAAPASPFTFTGGATIISDYRFRGVSQTNTHVALQGTFGVSHSSGFYVGTWGSSIHDYVSAGSDQEIDLYAGYKHTWTGGWATDTGVLYYYYPGNAKGSTTDFFEPYANVSHTYGPVGVKLGLNWAWSQHALRCDYDPRCKGSRESNLYTYGELSGAIPKTPITLTAHLGESWGRSYLTNGLKNYTDWSLTAAYTWKQLTLSVAYVDTDFKKGEIVSPATDGGHQLAKAGVVGAIGVAF